MTRSSASTRTAIIMNVKVLMLAMLYCSVKSKSTFSTSDDATEDEVNEQETPKAVVTVISEPSSLKEENLAVSAVDSYSLYKQLMEVKQQLTSSNTTAGAAAEPAAVTTLKTALGMLYDSLVEGVFKGFFPHVERQRREASDEKKTYLDIAVTTIGAVMGKQSCSRALACRTGRYVGNNVPSAGFLMMMAETYVPESFKSWFGVVKTASITSSDDNFCEHQYSCSLVH